MNRTIARQLCIYFSEHENDLDRYVQQWTYSCNNQQEIPTGTAKRNLAWRRTPPSHSLNGISKIQPSEIGFTPLIYQMRDSVLKRFIVMFGKTDNRSPFGKTTSDEYAERKSRYTAVFHKSDKVVIKWPSNKAKKQNVYEKNISKSKLPFLISLRYE